MTHDHDKLFHHTYSQPEHAISLLRAVLPKAIARGIDWQTLRLLPGTSVDESLRERRSDLLFAAWLYGKQVLLYVLIEHKSTGERLTAFQLLRYTVRAWDRYLAEHKDAESLPPIVPIVVHNGVKPFQAPRSLFELIDVQGLPPEIARALAALQPDLHFLLDDLAVASTEQTLARPGTRLDRLTRLAMQFVRLQATRDPVDFARRFRSVLVTLWTDPAGRADLYALLSYLAARLEVPRERLLAATAYIHQEARKMGKTIADQFREEGVQQGRVELLLRQLRTRFGAIPARTEATVRQADVATLDRWGEQLLTASSLDEALA